MAVNPVPFCLAEPSVEHSADLVRQAFSSLLNPAGGTVAANGLQVTAKEAPNMAVVVKGGDPAGQIWIPGTSLANQGMYFASVDSNTELAIGAASEANPRVDTVIARIFDKFYAGSENKFALEVIPGTPTGGIVAVPKTKAEAEADKAGAVPASSLVLAYVLVPKSAASIVAGDIFNVVAQMSLVATENKYTALPATLPNESHELSATRRVEVVLKYANVKGAKLIIGGEEFTTLPEGVTSFITFSLAPGGHWEVKDDGTGALSGKYRVL